MTTVTTMAARTRTKTMTTTTTSTTTRTTTTTPMKTMVEILITGMLTSIGGKNDGDGRDVNDDDGGDLGSADERGDDKDDVIGDDNDGRGGATSKEKLSSSSLPLRIGTRMRP